MGELATDLRLQNRMYVAKEAEAAQSKALENAPKSTDSFDDPAKLSEAITRIRNLLHGGGTTVDSKALEEIVAARAGSQAASYNPAAEEDR